MKLIGAVLLLLALSLLSLVAGVLVAIITGGPFGYWPNMLIQAGYFGLIGIGGSSVIGGLGWVATELILGDREKS